MLVSLVHTPPLVYKLPANREQGLGLSVDVFYARLEKSSMPPYVLVSLWVGQLSLGESTS